MEIKYNQVTKCDDGMKKKRARGKKGLVTKEKEKKMWAEDAGRCPVRTLKLYLSKLNAKNQSLFQRPSRSFSTKSDRWYDNQVLGVHSLENMVSTMSEKYCLSRRYTNHCIRASVVTELDRAGFAPTDICHVTGHRSAESLKHYCSKPSSDKSQKMSSALHSFITGDAQPSVSSTVQPSVSSEPHARDTSVNINVSKTLDNDVITGILSGAVFNGQVVINFNMSK